MGHPGVGGVSKDVAGRPRPRLDRFSEPDPRVVRGRVRRAHPRPGGGVGGDRGRAARAGGRARPGPARRSRRFLWSIDRLLTAPPPRGPARSAAGCSTSRRSRRSRSTSSATCARRWPASGRPPSGSAPRCPRSRVGVRSGDTPAAERRRLATHAARHPDHHARVAVPDAHLAGPRVAARRRDGDRRRGARRGRHQARRPPRALASSGSTSCSSGPPSGSGCPRRCARSRRWPASSAARAPVEIVAPPSDEGVGPQGRRPGRGHDRARRAYDDDLEGRRRRRAARRLDLAARRGARRRPDRAAPLDDRVRQLPPARRAAHRPAQRDRRRARAASAARAATDAAAPPAAGDGPVRRSADGADAGHRPGPPRLGLQGAAGAHRGRPQARPAALRGRHQQPRARHRHGRGRPGRPDRVAAVASPARCSASAAPATRSARSRAACCSPSTAATWCRPRSPSSGCAPARSRRCACPTNPLDVLAQQVVAATAIDAWDVDDAVRPRPPHRAVRRRCPRSAYDATLDLLSGRYPSDEFAELRPRIVWDRVAGTLTGRPGAQRLAVTSGGTIPDRGLFGVFLVGGEDRRRRVGELDEEMVYESRVGDVFALGATSWRIEDITHDRVLVSPAPGQPGPAAVLEGRRPRPARRARRGDRRVHPRARRAAARAGAVARAPSAGPRRRGPPTTWSRYLDEQREATSDAAAATARCWSSGSATSSATGGSSCTRPTARRCTPLGAGDQRPAARALRHRRARRWPPTTASCCASPRPTQDPPGADADRRSSPTRSRTSSPPRSAARRCSPPASASAPPGRCCCRAATPAGARRCGSSASAAPQLLEVAVEVPVLPDRPRGGPRVPPGRLRRARRWSALMRDLAAPRDPGRRRRRPTQPSPFARSLLFGYVAAFMYEGDSPIAERRAAALSLDQGLLAELLGRAELRELLDPEVLAEVEAELQRLDPRPAGPRRRGRGRPAAAARPAVDRRGRGAARRRRRRRRLARRCSPTRAASSRSGWAARSAGPPSRTSAGCATASACPVPPGTPDAFTEPVEDPLADLVAPLRPHPRAVHRRRRRRAARPRRRGRAARRWPGSPRQGRVLEGEFRPAGSGRRVVRRRGAAPAAAPVAGRAAQGGRAGRAGRRSAGSCPAWQHVSTGSAAAACAASTACSPWSTSSPAAPCPPRRWSRWCCGSRVVDYAARRCSTSSPPPARCSGPATATLPGTDGWVVAAPRRHAPA